MKMSAIAGQIGVRPADATAKVIREFGQSGSVKAQALEDGRVMLVVQGHESLELPADDWVNQNQAPFPGHAPVYATIVEPAVLPSTMQAAHQAADDALEAEARAKQAVEDLD